MANKLHEILAVEQDRKNRANIIIGETKKRFTKHTTDFEGLVKKYVPTEENAEEIPDETKEISLTVKEALDRALVPVAIAINATLSKEETNASGKAKAELIVGKKKFGEFAATTLLALESNLGKLLDLYRAIPTLDAARKYQYDQKINRYRSDEEIKFRTIKRPKVIVKYEATDKHPAQTELLNLDFQVGKYLTTYFSGKITQTQKTTLVEKLEQFIEAVKVARAKANNVDVNNVKLADAIFEYLHQDVF